MSADKCKHGVEYSEDCRDCDDDERHERDHSNTMTCPFCNEKDYDIVGLKSHLSKGECEVFESIETIRSLFDITL